MADGADYSESKLEEVDFSTGASLVDVVEVSDWAGVNRLQQRDYADVLYSKDEASIAHLAVKVRNWPAQLQQQFNMVKVSEREPIQIQSRSQRGGRLGGGLPTGRPGFGGRFGGRMDQFLGGRGGGMPPRGP